MIEPNNTPFQLSSSDVDVAETCLLTLCCHAQDSLSEDPIFRDEKSVELIQALKPALATAESLMKNLRTKTRHWQN